MQESVVTASSKQVDSDTVLCKDHYSVVSLTDGSVKVSTSQRLVIKYTGSS